MWESGPLGLPNIGLVLLCQNSFEHQISTHITHGPAFPRMKAHSSMYTHCKSDGFNFQRYFECETVTGRICSAPKQAKQLIHIHISGTEVPHANLACLGTTDTLNFLCSQVRGTCSSEID